MTSDQMPYSFMLPVLVEFEFYIDYVRRKYMVQELLGALSYANRLKKFPFVVIVDLKDHSVVSGAS